MSNKSALHQLAEFKSLQPVFDELYKSSSLSQRQREDSNGESLQKIKKHSRQYLAYLSYEIKNESYQPSKLTPFFIKKDKKKYRIICAPTIRDKIIQKAILKILAEKNYSLENSISHGFMSGKGVKSALDQALELRIKYPFAFKTDIISFFDKIDRGILKEKIKHRIKLKSLHSLINLIVDTEIEELSQSSSLKIKSAGVKVGQGIRQGMPLSPYLSNLILEDFDKFLIDQNIKAVRYADDLIFFSDSFEKSKEQNALIQEALRKVNLSIPELEENKKSIIYKPDEEAEFLGLSIKPCKNKTYKLVMPEKTKNKIRDNLSNYRNLQYCLANNITISKLLKRLEATKGGYEQYYDSLLEMNEINPLYDILRDLKKNIIIDLMKSSLSPDIDYSKLSKNQKKFWEIDGFDF
ncbi:MAG: hypothetical protein E6Q83_08270 [Thiothrix sp.]|nr:MAG: hypothetical protein E6Q83_08270 [Thiothrix sp.]